MLKTRVSYLSKMVVKPGNRQVNNNDRRILTLLIYVVIGVYYAYLYDAQNKSICTGRNKETVGQFLLLKQLKEEYLRRSETLYEQMIPKQCHNNGEYLNNKVERD